MVLIVYVYIKGAKGLVEQMQVLRLTEEAQQVLGLNEQM
jgi:hypothetical protein